MKILALSVVSAVLAAPAFAESHVTGDATAGEAAFAKQCVSCHVVVNDAGETLAGRRAKTGPNLYGVALRQLGSVPDFRYSSSLVEAGAAGLVWDEENFVGYVQDPTGWLRAKLEEPKARGKMSFKVRKEEDAHDIYAFLESVGPEVVEKAAVEPVKAADPEKVAEPIVAPEPAKVAEPIEAPEPAVAEIPVSFSSDQADRGEGKYKKECEECHGDDLKGGLNGGAPLRGLSFEQKFLEGSTASSMFQYMSAEMPPNKPGRFSASTYADLMAYVLKRNGFDAGAELPTDLDALDAMIIQK